MVFAKPFLKPRLRTPHLPDFWYDKRWLFFYDHISAHTPPMIFGTVIDIISIFYHTENQPQARRILPRPDNIHRILLSYCKYNLYYKSILTLVFHNFRSIDGY